MAEKTKPTADEPLERKLWKAADKLRKNMDAAEYKHIVLGLIFLKYISDAFDELYQELSTPEMKAEGANPEYKTEYSAEKVFYVPPIARWKYIQGRATQPTIGKDVDDAMEAIEKDNPASLRGVLPKVFAQEKLDKASLGGLINLISSAVLGTKEAQSKDILGRVFEYFLGEFALAEGKKGGQFYTPGSVVRLLVEMLARSSHEGSVLRWRRGFSGEYFCDFAVGFFSEIHFIFALRNMSDALFLLVFEFSGTLDRATRGRGRDSDFGVG